VPAGTHTVGLRPEHAQIAPDGPIAMHVSQVEQLGSTSLLHGSVGKDTPFEMVINGQTSITGGDNVHVAMPRAYVHCFDAQGLRL
jgi:multiple sugar transport system ATP-binding protein